MPMMTRDPLNKTHMVIVGGGAAGLNCAETLRQSNFTGQITVISGYEKDLPSKRDSAFLDAYAIEYQLGYEVEKIDPKNKNIQLFGGGVVSYDKLLLAGNKAEESTLTKPDTQPSKYLEPVRNYAKEHLLIDENEGIKTNPFMQTSDNDIFAVGGCASFPLFATG